ncbi:hypothetical protein [Neptunicella marina]|uniref:Uncharacterized protein n=1 Tax=Neptunicella marina TaxID=2125989 RepID=A0A8J6IX31_9ALTE|nr:hypothetical protein [Neptunicella marina]MBC3766948.1 hypothetical protein [Neptunicella marina]
MIKKKPIAVIFTMILLLSILWIAQQQLIDKNAQFSNSCELNSDSCHLFINGDAIQITVQKYPVELEEEIRFVFVLPDGYQWQNGYVTGSNMYMGKIPMLPESEIKGPLQVVTFLGSCSEPHMRWMATVNLKNIKTGKQQMLFIRFQTNRR